MKTLITYGLIVNNTCVKQCNYSDKREPIITILNLFEAKQEAVLTFSNWIKYLTANKPQQDNIKAHTLHYNPNVGKLVKAYNVRPNCVNCNTKLSKYEKEQGSLCSDCINENNVNYFK